MTQRVTPVLNPWPGLIEAYRARFGEHIPYSARTDVKGFVSRKPVWLMRQLSVAQVLCCGTTDADIARRAGEVGVEHQDAEGGH